MSSLLRSLKGYLALLLVLGGISIATPATAATGDNYPAVWRDKPLGATYDTWGMATRFCTSWVAWALHDRNGYEIPFHDHAKNWGSHGVTPNMTPAKGAVAWWNTGTYGHVAYVESVNRNAVGTIVTVTISEYNNPSGSGAYNLRTIDKNAVSGYLHFKDIAETPPDPDNDGFASTNDLCPTTWGKYRGCPLRSDFSNDGKAEVAAFYRHDGNATNLVLWNGQDSRYTSGPYGPWASGDFDASRLHPAGSGKFNGDNYQDTAAFFAHDNGMLDLDVWYGNATGDLSPAIAWHVDTGWEGDRLIPVGAGDFNGDGHTDIAAFYRYDGNKVALYAWTGQAGNTMQGPYPLWSGDGWDGTRIIPVGVGDVDGDNMVDIATFYRHDNGAVDYNIWFGRAGGGFALGRPWRAASGWDASRFVPAGLHDITGDHRAEAIVFYRHDNYVVDMRVWFGTASRVTGEPGGPWSATGWDGARIIPAGTDDYNGDGAADVATFYRHEGQMMDLNIWYGDGTGRLQLFRAWHAATGWEGGRLIPAKG